MVEGTSAGFLQMNKLLREVHDVGIFLLTHVCQEMQEGLLLICGLGVSELHVIKDSIDNYSNTAACYAYVHTTECVSHYVWCACVCV